MKRIAQTFLLLVLFSSTLLAGTTHRYIVATHDAVELPRVRTLVRDVATDETIQEQERNLHSFRIVNGFAANLTDDEAAALRQHAGVDYVAPAVERHALDLGPKQTFEDMVNPYGQVVPYGVDLVHARDVWPVTRGNGINVVVIDTGIDKTHPELSAVYAGGFNELNQGADPADDNGHGTHVAGTIAAADNNVGVVGVAPNVRLWSVKVLDSTGSGSSADIISALDWATQQKNSRGGDWVLNLSLGSTQPDPTERQAFENAIANGLLICAAAGNESTATLPSPIDYPAGYDGVLAIGAVDQTRTIASFSNQGPNLAVVAPGVNVLSTVPVGSGSMAGVQSSVGNFSAVGIEYSGRGTLSGQYVTCGIGQTTDFPPTVAGKIALIQRGTITFNQKTRNAIAAGAIAVVIYNNADSDLSWTLASADDPTATTFAWPVTIALSQADGTKLAGAGSGQITVMNVASDYESLSGTSMATPHATGVAALVWSAAPALGAADVAKALEANADDLGATGFDSVYGNGLIDALTAAKAVAPSKFSNPTTTPPPPTGKTHAVRHF